MVKSKYIPKKQDESDHIREANDSVFDGLKTSETKECHIKVTMSTHC